MKNMLGIFLSSGSDYRIYRGNAIRRRLYDSSACPWLPDRHALGKTMFLLGLGLSAALIWGCKPEKKNVVDEEDLVLAKVNGTELTSFDVQRAMKTSFRELKLENAGSGAERKVLESLVANRAIAQAMEKELDQKEKAVLEKDVLAYREKLLVKQYLEKHAPVKQVTETEMKQFFEENEAKLGVVKQRVFEMISSPRSLAETEKADWIEAMEALRLQNNWPAQVRAAQTKNVAVVYHRGQALEKVLNDKLKAVISRQKPGEVSPIVFIDGVGYVVRVIEDKSKSGSEYTDVREKIRQMLAQRAIQTSIEEVTKEVMQQSTVEYLNAH